MEFERECREVRAKTEIDFIEKKCIGKCVSVLVLDGKHTVVLTPIFFRDTGLPAKYTTLQAFDAPDAADAYAKEVSRQIANIIYLARAKIKCITSAIPA